MTKMRAFILAEFLFALTVIAGVLLYLNRGDDTPQSLAQYQTTYVDGPAMLNLTETLSSDALQGRETGTEGNAAARGFILKRFETIGLRRVGDAIGRREPSGLDRRQDARQGADADRVGAL